VLKFAPGLGGLNTYDNSVNQRVALAKLKSMGCEVVTGREAFDAATSKPFDLVLMDCQMPEMDGYQATALIRERGIIDAAGRHTALPIIALTANAIEGDRERCLAASMNDYITKPYTTAQMFTVLTKWLGPGANS
jgi:two-component system sensor histidine kinase/response regulator